MKSDASFFAVFGAAVLALVLAAAFFTLPYGVYTLLRLSVAAWCVGVVLRALRGILPLAFFPVCFGVIFNPLVPFRFPRASWEILDLLCAAVILLTEVAFAVFALRTRRSLQG